MGAAIKHDILKINNYNGSSGKEIWVIAALLEVHDDVQQGDLVSSSFGIQSLKVLCQDKFVVLSANRQDTLAPFPMFSRQFFSTQPLTFALS